MNLKIGDFVSGNGISIGEFLGIQELGIQGADHFMKIKDSHKQAIHYLPVSTEANFRKLPSKSTITRNLNVLKEVKPIDIGEIEGSRYNYFKAKLEKNEFKSEIEVFHDLQVLKRDKEATLGEKKLLNGLKEKLVYELGHILAKDSKEVESMLELQTLPQ